MVIPAHPLALTPARKLDERRQRALTRYYLDAGASGIAVGVHTTQFAIRSPKIGLYRPVLELAAETVARWERSRGQAVLRVAGVVGTTRQATSEARIARDLGYDVGLLSLGALSRASDAQLMAHCRAVAQAIPLMGFYLQPSVGGRALSYRFWRRFVEIDEVVAIKIAPFNRYATLDVIRAVADAGREKEIALLTGNDDSIVADLLTTWRFRRGQNEIALRMSGGLLGHWAYWTRAAVRMVDRVARARGRSVPATLLSLGAATTDANGAIFDAANGFRGCIPGIHEVLRRQGLLRGRWCLDPKEELSPGQMQEIDRVCAAYPQLSDDEFVKQNLDRWMA
jgi:hypothetical protein